jgi:hypothetical protein
MFSFKFENANFNGRIKTNIYAINVIEYKFYLTKLSWRSFTAKSTLHNSKGSLLQPFVLTFIFLLSLWKEMFLSLSPPKHGGAAMEN